MEYFPWIAGGMIAVIVAGLVAHATTGPWHDFDARARGLTPQERLDEVQFRHAMIRLRARATAAAIADPANAYQMARDIAEDEAETLKLIDRAVARHFLKTFYGLGWTEVFYPEALAALDAYWKNNRIGVSMPKHVEDAAYTTLR